MNQFYRKILFICILSISIVGLLYSSYILYNYYQYSQIELAFSQSEIQLNPYGNAPLSAVLNIDTSQEGYFKIRVEGKGEEGIPIEYKKPHNGGIVNLSILGLYLDYNNQVSIGFFNEKNEEIYNEKYEIETEGYIGLEPKIEVTINTLPQTYQGLYGFVNTRTLFDQNGDIRWYLDNQDFHSIFTKLRNGNLLVASNRDTIMYQFKHFYEISPLGEIVKEYSVPNMYHHEILELENGNFLTTGNSESFLSLTDSVYREDTIIEIDRKTGKIIDELNIDDVLYGIRPTYEEMEEITFFLGGVNLSSNTGDWAHINSLYVDSNNNVILSMRTIDMVASINRDTEELNWVLSHKAMDYESTKDYALELVNTGNKEEFSYFLGQHSVVTDYDNNLYIFDNGMNRDKYSKQENNYSRVLKYKIDTQVKKTFLLSSYKHPREIYTPFSGNVILLENGGMLIGYTVNVGDGIHLVQTDAQDNIILEIAEKSKKRDYRVINIDITI